MPFHISSEPISVDDLMRQLASDTAGACATFEGWVRNHSAGRNVIRLEYEAYDVVAIAEGEKIVNEAIARFGLAHASCIHRVGTLEVGEMAVWVGVSASHRGEAFAACRYIIDEVKARCPIWKKEHFAEGGAGWSGTDANPGAEIGRDAESRYYARQAVLPCVGVAGQARLKNARVLMVGVGGLGCPAAAYLATAGIGTIILCDGDRVEASNLHRQILFEYADIGKPKVVAAAERLRKMNPFISVDTVYEHLSTQNAQALVAQCDVVLDCTDNFAAKFMINDAAVLCARPAVFAGIYQFEGQLQTYAPGKTACLRCVWQQVPEPGCVANCVDAGVLGAVPGVFGALQSVEALKLILNMGEGGPPSQILMIDLLSQRPHRVVFPPDLECRVCGVRPTIVAMDPGNYGFDDALEFDPMRGGLASLTSFSIFDIRETDEVRQVPISGWPTTHMPLSAIDVGTFASDPSVSYLVCCARGARSLRLTKELRARGRKNVMSLAGGAAALNALLAKK